MKAILIIDKSESYLSLKRDEILAKWGAEKSHEKHDSMMYGASSSLFGEAPTVVVNLVDSGGVKKSVTTMEQEFGFDTNFPSGVIVLCTVARNQTKKLESLFAKHGGKVYIPNASKNKGDIAAIAELKSLGLNREVTSFLVDYAGNDPDSIIAILRALKKIPKDYRPKVSFEDVLIRLPKGPGGVPPWDVETALFNSDLPTLLKTAERASEGSSPILYLSVLKKKFDNYLRVSLMLNERKSENEIIATLGLPKRGFYYTQKRASNLGTARLLKAMRVITEAEMKMKGGSRVPIELTAKEFLVDLRSIVR